MTTTHQIETYHGGEPGGCTPCKGTGFAYGSPEAQCGSCHHCEGTGEPVEATRPRRALFA